MTRRSIGPERATPKRSIAKTPMYGFNTEGSGQPSPIDDGKKIDGTGGLPFATATAATPSNGDGRRSPEMLGEYRFYKTLF